MSNERYTNLEYLNEMTGGDPDFTREMIEMFLLQIEEFRSELYDFYNTQSWKELGELAHKAKSSMLTFGMEELGWKLKELQLKTQKLEDIDNYKSYLDLYDAHCNKAIIELQNDLKNL
ncbi:MAG: Hpt domain-containing protein [Mangrovibacterium sp.]